MFQQITSGRVICSGAWKGRTDGGADILMLFTKEKTVVDHQVRAKVLWVCPSRRARPREMSWESEAGLGGGVEENWRTGGKI